MEWNKSECFDPRCDWSYSLDRAALYRGQKGHLQMTQTARKGKLYQLQYLIDLSYSSISYILVVGSPNSLIQQNSSTFLIDLRDHSPGDSAGTYLSTAPGKCRCDMPGARLASLRQSPTGMISPEGTMLLSATGEKLRPLFFAKRRADVAAVRVCPACPCPVPDPGRDRGRHR